MVWTACFIVFLWVSDLDLDLDKMEFVSESFAATQKTSPRSSTFKVLYAGNILNVHTLHAKADLQ